MDDEGATPLVVCAQYGHEDLVEALLERGADVDAAAHSGCTALVYACGASQASFSERLVEKLLDHGADPNIPELHHGSRALHYLAATGHERLCRELVMRAPTRPPRTTAAGRPRTTRPTRATAPAPRSCGSSPDRRRRRRRRTRSTTSSARSRSARPSRASWPRPRGPERRRGGPGRCPAARRRARGRGRGPAPQVRRPGARPLVRAGRRARRRPRAATRASRSSNGSSRRRARGNEEAARALRRRTSSQSARGPQGRRGIHGDLREPAPAFGGPRTQARRSLCSL